MWFLSDNPEFAEIYQKSVDMLKDREALLTMFQSVFNHEDVAGSINLTNESAIKRMTKEIDQKNTRIREQENQIHTQETQIQAQESLLLEKDKEIAELKKQLNK